MGYRLWTFVPTVTRERGADSIASNRRALAKPYAPAVCGGRRNCIPSNDRISNVYAAIASKVKPRLCVCLCCLVYLGSFWWTASQGEKINFHPTFSWVHSVCLRMAKNSAITVNGFTDSSRVHSCALTPGVLFRYRSKLYRHPPNAQNKNTSVVGEVETGSNL